MEEYANKAFYEAYKAKDTRFDGRFFIGVASTGIYCRPVCRAKQPKKENCTFYPTAAAAEKAGYRPCLLCRPELAPGTAIVDAAGSLARRAARLLEESCGSGQRLAELASGLDCTERHLRRAFVKEYQVSPVQYLQTWRLLLAKNLLAETSLTVLEVAMASGFGSLRRLNSLFQKQYQLSPTALRKRAALGEKVGADITVALGYRPPYPWQQVLQFLEHRSILGVEAIRDNQYWHTVRMVATDGEGKKKAVQGWVCVGNAPDRNVLTVTIAPALLPVLPQILSKVRHLFDLYCDPETVYTTLAGMNGIRSGLSTLGTRLPGCLDPFEITVRAVLGQQITVKAASTLAARFVNAYGMPLHTGIGGLTHAFPVPEEILALPGNVDDHLGPLGITAAKAKAIWALSRAFVQKDIQLELGVQPEAEIQKLMALPGIGAWTAHYIAMRAMGWTDAFLETDIGVQKALVSHSVKEMLQMAEAWRPWRSYAVINLWQSLQKK